MNIEELSEELDNLPKGQKKTILAVINHEIRRIRELLKK